MKTESGPRQADQTSAGQSGLLSETKCVVLDLSTEVPQVIFAEGRTPSEKAARASRHPLLAPVSVSLSERLPTAQALEHAIEVVENAVMPLARHIQTGSRLLVQSNVLEPLWRAQGSHGTLIAIDSVEAAFLDLAAAAESRHFSSGSVPFSPDLAAHLLILREAMHHWGFVSVALSQGGQCAFLGRTEPDAGGASISTKTCPDSK